MISGKFTLQKLFETNFPEIIGIDEGFDKAIFEWGIGDKLETLSLPFCIGLKD